MRIQIVHRSTSDDVRGGIETIYNERLFGVGGFPSFLSLLILMYKQAIDGIKTALTVDSNAQD